MEYDEKCVKHLEARGFRNVGMTSVMRGKRSK